MASQNSQQVHPPLHFVLFPFMAQGHMIPMVDIARLLAQRGVTITIVTTPHNAERFKNVFDRAIESGLPINVVHVKLPYAEAGLPEGKENLDLLDSIEFRVPFFKAANMLEEPVLKLLEDMKPRPSCLVSSFCLPYTSKIAKAFNIPKIVFHGLSCFCLLCMHVLRNNLEILENLKSDKEYFYVPSFPDRVQFTKPQFPVSTNEKGGWTDILDAMIEADNTSYGVITNTFQELEPAYVKEYKDARDGKVWSIGPVSFICNLPLSQLKELGLGLEKSKRPFIWVIRGWENGFEERVKERGLLIKGWAPQVLILSHPSVGGFLTHCGWNSTLEGITSGVPLLTWPLFGDQFCNQKLIVQVLKVGVGAGIEEVMKWGEEEKIGVLVDNEGVKKAVEELMGDGDDAEERRRRAKELGELAHRAVEDEGGSSHSNITLLLQDISQLAQSKN
ncbi:BnaC04g08480D [Brassica napus]|uniref:Glycosyltransferase n=1 Tax=Brassica napus TaxID=3708 RepID=A0A078H5P8_BRANA|nr:BnaC04g08480D [Brassica napus]